MNCVIRDQIFSGKQNTIKISAISSIFYDCLDESVMSESFQEDLQMDYIISINKESERIKLFQNINILIEKLNQEKIEKLKIQNFVFDGVSNAVKLQNNEIDEDEKIDQSK